MDEYNLANVFLNHDEIQKHIVDLDSFQKIPFTELFGLGGAIAELIPQFRTVTTTTTIPMEGMFRAINPKTGEVMSDLMYESKQVADAFIGSMRQPNGEFDQTAFQKVVGVKEIDYENTIAVHNHPQGKVYPYRSDGDFETFEKCYSPVTAFTDKKHSVNFPKI